MDSSLSFPYVCNSQKYDRLIISLDTAQTDPQERDSLERARSYKESFYTIVSSLPPFTSICFCHFCGLPLMSCFSSVSTQHYCCCFFFFFCYLFLKLSLNLLNCADSGKCCSCSNILRTKCTQSDLGELLSSFMHQPFPRP